MKHPFAFTVAAVLIAALGLLSPLSAAQSVGDVERGISELKKKKKSDDEKSKKEKGSDKKSSGKGDKGGADVWPPPGDLPPIAKDFLHINAFTLSAYQKNNAVWSWVPKVKLRVNGPIESGSQVSVEFILPTGPWVKLDCKTEQVQKGYFLDTEGGAREVPEDKGVTYTGPVEFVIRLRNELAGTESELYKGKFTVTKAHSNEAGEAAAEHFVYYVDHDWNLPIAYLCLKPDSVYEWKRPWLNAVFWVRGDAVEFEPHLFYQGKEVGKVFIDNHQRGQASAEYDLEINPTQSVEDSMPQKAKWARVVCDFPSVMVWDNSGDKPADIPGQTGSMHNIKPNPGEYEVKVLRKGKLARSIKFTVSPDGRFDNGIATTNKLGSHRFIVPVQIIGDQDGQWDRGAWKTGAYYGNPLEGFTPAP
ncbi:hypothetical protein RAS1_16300 [Phycisphaerae bacterium RAS1]|nr:hypothetical protein RAS1_16300 [Phycisphaerae bacterium RAS1]